MEVLYHHDVNYWPMSQENGTSREIAVKAVKRLTWDSDWGLWNPFNFWRRVKATQKLIEAYRSGDIQVVSETKDNWDIICKSCADLKCKANPNRKK